MVRLLPFLLGLVVYLFFAVYPANATQTYQEGSVLFTDDFADGNYNGWTVESGDWSIDSAKQLTGFKSGSKKTGRLNYSGTWDNFRLEVDIDNRSGIDEGVGFRRTDSDNTYEVTLRHGTGSYDTPQIILTKVQAGVNTQLFSTNSVPLSNNVTYHVKIEAVSEHIQMWVDSTLVFDLDDAGTAVKSGGISFSYWTGDVAISNMRYDNVKLTSLSKQLYPVIFIPGLGGSELKTAQDVIWSKDNGHAGTFSHAYPGGEKVWVNETEAAKLGDDDYFDILKLKSDGVVSEADLSLTGNLTSYGYSEIDSFFQSAGYTKGTNFFVFNYDWRKDVSSNKTSFDTLIDEAKTKSGQPKANIVAHSMGGLIARDYIADTTKASKINKLISLGVPHLGSPKFTKALMYGVQVGPSFLLGLISLNTQEVKDVLQNFTSGFELNPTGSYYDFYNNSSQDLPYPFQDERDIDSNTEKGSLSYNQLKTLLTNLSYNMTVFNLAEQFHNSLSTNLNTSNNVKIYHIVGSSQPTLGQIRETWYITWPIKLLPKREEIFINGDGTIPLYSASLKSSSKDLSAGATLYYVEQDHSDLVKSSGAAMSAVKAILGEGDAVPSEVKSEKIYLEGKQVSVDDATLDIYDDSGNHTGLDTNGEVETKIPKTFYSSIENNTNIFVKKSSSKVTVKVSKASRDKTSIKILHYSQDKVSKTSYYREVPTGTGAVVSFDLDPTSDTSPILLSAGTSVTSTSEVTGSTAIDQTPPSTKVEVSGTKDSQGNYLDSLKITLTASDAESGVLKTEYSTDDGKTIKIYDQPFTITTTGDTTLQIKSIDKLGNEESAQSVTYTIISSVTPTPTPTPTSSSSSSSSNSSSDSSTSSTVAETIVSSAPQIKIANQVFESPVIALKNQNPIPQVLGVAVDRQEADQQKPSILFKFLIIPAVLAGMASIAFVGSLLFQSGGIGINLFRKWF